MKAIQKCWTHPRYARLLLCFGCGQLNFYCWCVRLPFIVHARVFTTIVSAPDEKTADNNDELVAMFHEKTVRGLINVNYHFPYFEKNSRPPGY